MIDLHLHLDGSLSEEDVLFLAEKSGVVLPQPLSLSVDECASLTPYLEKFALPLSVLQTEETVSLAVSRLLARLKEQGLIYAEIRFAPQLHRKRGLTQEQVVCAAIRGIDNLKANLILCCMRGGDESENRETVRLAEKYLSKGVCALDLAGDESKFPTRDYPYLRANVPLTVHAGEAAGAESVEEAVSLGARRIGHGIRARADDLEGIAVESCFTSNLQTKATTRETYPIKEFLARGIEVCLCTDNMTVSNTTLKQEYEKVQKWGNFSREEMKNFALNAAKNAFLSDEERTHLTQTIKESFDEWLQ